MSRFHLFVIPHLNSGKASRSSCFAWYTYGAIISHVHMSVVEIILAIRGRHFPLRNNHVRFATESLSVYALFNKSRRIAIILGLEIMLEYAMLMHMIIRYFPEIIFVPYCILIKPPYSVDYHT